MSNNTYFDYDKIRRDAYIEEITNYKTIATSVYQMVIAQQHEQVKQYADRLKQQEQQTSAPIKKDFHYEQYQWSLGQNELAAYHILTSLYIGLATIEELQAYDYGITKSEFKNPTIATFNDVVNVLKHGKFRTESPKKKEIAYDRLRRNNSRFLRPAKHFTNLSDTLSEGVILDISMEHLVTICDELITFWQNYH